MSPCEACRAHRRRWLANAGYIERSWLALSPLVIIALLVFQIASGH